MQSHNGLTVSLQRYRVVDAFLRLGIILEPCATFGVSSRTSCGVLD